MVIDTLLPALQAPASESDQAAATSAWSFIRAFGSIWGVAIPATIFNNGINDNLNILSDPIARQLLGRGGAYQQASAVFVPQFSLSVQDEIRSLYISALDCVFRIGVIFLRTSMLVSPTRARGATQTATSYTVWASKAERVWASGHGKGH